MTVASYLDPFDRPPDELSLDRLNSYEDRQALKKTVELTLAPPAALVGVYAKLREDAAASPEFFFPNSTSGTKKAQSENAQLASEMARAHLEGTGRALREAFRDRVGVMLDWARRLRWSTPNAYWRPCDWVQAASSMEAQSVLMGMVMEHAHATSWKAWSQAFELEKEWAGKWRAWEEAYRRAPAGAPRWLEALISACPPQDAAAIALMGQSQARLGQFIWLAGRTGHSTALLQEMEDRILEAGASSDFRGLDVVPFFFEADGSPHPPAAALGLFRSFLLSSGEHSVKQWLKWPASLSAAMLPTNPPHARARRLPLFFRGLGKHGIASARNLRVVTSAWFENASAWERDFWLPLFAQFGELAEEAPRRPIKSAAPKKKAKPKAKKPASTKERTVVPQASSKETEPFIPRFPGR